MTENAAPNTTEQTMGEKEAYLETLKTFLAEKLAKIDAHAQWYKRRANHEKRLYFIIRIPMMVASVILSLLVSLEMAGKGHDALSVTILTLSLLISFLGSLDALLGYGRAWVEKRKSELVLYSILRRYTREQIRISSPSSVDDAIKCANEIIDALNAEYEEAAADSVDEFVKRSAGTEAAAPASHAG